MVQITLHPANHANHSGRYFPCSGYLGLTKVQVSGIVRTRIEDDHKLLPAHRLTISIKCYELRSKLHHSRCNVLVDVTDTLWTPPDDKDIGEIGDLDLPFRITLPADTAGHSTLQFPDYKIFWRIEAAIEHPQQFGLGSRLARVFDLDLTRYDVQNQLNSGIPSGYRPSPPSKHIEPFHYRITRPTSPTGPGDELPLEVSLLLPSSPSQSISLSCTLERKLNLYEAAGSPTPPDLLLPSAPSTSTLANYQSAAASSSTSLLSSLPSSSYPSLSRKRSDSPPAANVLLHSKSITSPIVTGTTSNVEYPSATEAVGRLVLSLPAKPPPSQWPIGESLKTDLAEIKFELRFKVVFNTPSGPQEVTLPSEDIRLCPISQEQRSVARDAIARKKEKLKEKEKEKMKAKSKSAPNSRRNSPIAEKKTLGGKMDVGRTKSSPGTSRTAAESSKSSSRGGDGAKRRGSLTLDRKEKNINRLDLFPPDLDYISTSGSSRAEPDTPPPFLSPQFAITQDGSKSSPNTSSMDISSYFDTHGVTTHVDGHATSSSALTFASTSSTSTHETKSHLMVEREVTTPVYATRSGSASTSALSNFPFSTPSDRATSFPFTTPADRITPPASSPATTTPSKTKSKEDIGNGWNASSKFKRLPLLSTYSSSTVRAKITPPVRSPLSPPSSIDQLRIGITTPTSLKRMPSSAIRQWEEELEKITSKSKSSSDNMPRGFSRDRAISNASMHASQVASTATARGLAPTTMTAEMMIGSGSRERTNSSVSQGHGDREGGREKKEGKVRRSTVNALTAWGIPLPSGSGLSTGPPSSFRMGGRSARA